VSAFWQEMREILAITKGFLPIQRAARWFWRAVALQRKGKTSDARKAVCHSLDLLRHPNVVRTSPQALTMILAATTLLDDVVTALGERDAAVAEMKDALDVCDAAIARHPRLAEADYLREHTERFRARLLEQGAGARP
jgi:hypothetical protein